MAPEAHPRQPVADGDAGSHNMGGMGGFPIGGVFDGCDLVRPVAPKVAETAEGALGDLNPLTGSSGGKGSTPARTWRRGSAPTPRGSSSSRGR